MAIEYRYDGTFQGFLTAVFDVYSRKEQPEAILRLDDSTLLFSEKYKVETDLKKSERVWNGIIKTGGAKTGKQVYLTFLSCEKDIEMTLLRYIQHLFALKRSIMGDFTNPDVLKVHQLCRTVSKESHRVLMFLRFEQAADGTFFAPYAPKYDVLSLTLSHFKSRFTDQKWLIYDTLRNYGFYYDTKKIEQVEINDPAFNEKTGKLLADISHLDEDRWQEIWRAYFKKIAIAERKNLKQQLNFMPKRFWKYLTEKM
ncbi:MAG: TIGR03915 family putative DNA repair protein [Marinilabiliaceae bacterium]|nr:TIGR03915 family putative DNA repair protein [Marinilabiliaceae bacterium]